jgi:hypothetical protein
MGFEVLVATRMKMAVSWAVAPFHQGVALMTEAESAS